VADDPTTRVISHRGAEAMSFLALTLAIAFVAGGAVAASSRGWLALDLPASIAGIAIASPAIVAVGLTWRREGSSAVRELLARMLRWRVGLRFYLAAVLMPPAIHLIALLVAPAPEAGMPHELRSVPLAALPLVFLVGSAMEELGWRGYAQPRLQDWIGPLVTSLVIGTVWALWHVPLALVQGSPKGSHPSPCTSSTSSRSPRSSPGSTHGPMPARCLRPCFTRACRGLALSCRSPEPRPTPRRSRSRSLPPALCCGPPRRRAHGMPGGTCRRTAGDFRTIRSSGKEPEDEEAMLHPLTSLVSRRSCRRQRVRSR
jgi:membrane protease YdiL (CAAX protease family)